MSMSEPAESRVPQLCTSCGGPTDPSAASWPALRDPMTGVAGLQLLREVGSRLLGLARRYGRWSCALHLRLGGMTNVLRSLSRPEQTMLLQWIGRRLSRCLRDTDVVARVGPERFAIVLSDLWEPEACAGVASRVLRELTNMRVPGRRGFSDVRVGVAIFPTDADDLDVLLHHAAAACDRPHMQGTSIAYHDPVLGAKLRAGLEIAQVLKNGPDSIRSQMFLAFQPIFSLDGNRLVGAEALSRWQHPTRGTLVASSFIPEAERTGRIFTIDRWALESALAQTHEWHQDGWDGWVSVNMSARSFSTPHVVPLVLNTLRDTDVEPDALVIEVTESDRLRELPAAGDTIAELQQHGIRVAIDDFGSGYASFQYVNELDASFIKIDRSFLVAAETESRHARLLESMIDMAHKLEKPVISEGVETPDQRARLVDAGCDFMQGWIAGEAIAGSSFEHRWLA
jgi:EAL domain-containing protein (putative c-di-GMP-specific phosphodiesterase class I)